MIDDQRFQGSFGAGQASASSLQRKGYNLLLCNTTLKYVKEDEKLISCKTVGMCSRLHGAWAVGKKNH